MIALPSPWKRALILLLILAVTAAGTALFFFSDHASHTKDEHAGHDQAVREEHEGHGPVQQPDTGGQGSIWTCSMHPQIQLPGPGKCPICFMDLIELKQETPDAERTGLRQITLTREEEKRADIALSPVVRRALQAEIPMTGTVEYDETRQKTITAWTAGRIDTLFVDASGTRVRTGQPLASIYSPELFAAQAEVIQARKAMERARTGTQDLIRRTAARTLDAARKKLNLLGLSAAQITRIEERGTPQKHSIIRAPMSGLVITKNITEGMYVTTGQTLYTLADLSRVWVVLQAYENDLPWIHEKMKVSFTCEAYPGHTMTGNIVYIDPVVDAGTRTVAVRMDVANPKSRLKPGMFVKAVIAATTAAADGETSPLLIPDSAPLITGKRAVVYVAAKDRPGVYEGREIVLGPRAGGMYVVTQGLREGEEVVTRGAFRIDSALQIMARPSMMNPQISTRSSAPMSGAHQHNGQPMLPAQSSAKSPALQTESLQPLFLSKLSFLSQDLAAIGRKIHTRKLDAARNGYENFGKKLRAIDGSLIPGESGLIWKELRMLLLNDAVLGAEATTIKRLKELHALTTRHMTALRTAMDVDGYERHWSAPPPQSGLVASLVARLYSAYSPLMEALAGDDAPTARAAAALMAEQLKKARQELLKDKALPETWDIQATAMRRGLAKILVPGSDLAAMRIGFEPVSASLIHMISRFGAPSPSPLYALFCPMAFNNKGATWVQKDEAVRNPYFGAAMFTCGEVSRQLTAE